MSEVESASLYHVYVDNNWTGPFDLAQLRALVQDGRLGVEGFAYDHESQSHILIGRLIGSVEDTVNGCFTDDGRDLLAAIEQALANRASPLLRDAVSRMKDQIGFSQEHRDDLRLIAGRLNSRPHLGRAEEIRHLLAETVAGDRQAAVLLLDELARTLDVLPGAAPQAPADDSMLEEARVEVGRMADELRKVQQAYDQVLREHDRASHDANQSIERLQYEVANEREARVHCQAEIRMLAAEILRLAQEARTYDPSLAGDIERLERALADADLNDLAIIAERLLVQALSRFRDLARTPDSAMGGLMGELEGLRARLTEVQKAADLAIRERDEAVVKLEEQRQAAGVALQLAKQRERKLRSTVTALEITRDLYSDTLRDLEGKVGSDQARVAGMEHELARVRETLEQARDHQTSELEQLEETLRRSIEMRATLRARKDQLESELGHARDDDGADDESGIRRVAQLEETRQLIDQRLGEQEAEIEALTDEIKERRDGTSRLRGRSDQLWGELDQARGDLSLAKRRFSELQAAYDRIDTERESLLRELQARKGTETISGKGTDSGHKGGDGKDPAKISTDVFGRETGIYRSPEEGTGRITRLKVELAEKDAEVEQVVDRNQVLQDRMEELTADRDYLKVELDRMRTQQGADQERTANALAEATKAALAAEKRVSAASQKLAEREARVAALEQEVARLQSGEGKPGGETKVLRKQIEAFSDEREELELRLVQTQGQTDAALRERLERAEAELSAMRVELAQAKAENARLRAELERIDGEKDRLQEAFDRLKGEHESAAVEHRASLKSARDRLIESQARVQKLEADLELSRASSSSAPHPAISALSEGTSMAVGELGKRLAKSDQDVQTAHRTIDELRAKVKALEAVRHHADGGAGRLEKAVNRVSRLRRSLRRARRRITHLRQKVRKAGLDRQEAMEQALSATAEAERLSASRRAVAEALGVPLLPGGGEESGARPQLMTFDPQGPSAALSRRHAPAQGPVTGFGSSGFRPASGAAASAGIAPGALLPPSTRFAPLPGATARRTSRTTRATFVSVAPAPLPRRTWRSRTLLGCCLLAGGLLSYGLLPTPVTETGTVVADRPLAFRTAAAGLVRDRCMMRRRGETIPSGTLILAIASDRDVQAESRTAQELAQADSALALRLDRAVEQVATLRAAAAEQVASASATTDESRRRLDQAIARIAAAEEAVSPARSQRDRADGEREALRQIQAGSDQEARADQAVALAQERLTAAVRAVRTAQEARTAAQQQLRQDEEALARCQALATAWNAPLPQAQTLPQSQPLPGATIIGTTTGPSVSTATSQRAVLVREHLQVRLDAGQVDPAHADPLRDVIESLRRGEETVATLQRDHAAAEAVLARGRIVAETGFQLLDDLPEIGTTVQAGAVVVRGALPEDRVVALPGVSLGLAKALVQGCSEARIRQDKTDAVAGHQGLRITPALTVQPDKPDGLTLGSTVQVEFKMDDERWLDRLRRRLVGFLVY